jgi:peptidoglycan/LPS O-acetylase OafA/YrhL
MRYTVEDSLVAASGRPSGFDYMRLSLALSVVVWHTVEISYGRAAEQAIWNTSWRTVLGLILPMFFALSGFLVAGSLDRSKTLVTFLGLRTFRIVPALAGDVLLSALILGPIITTMPLESYFSDFQFRSYFLNIVGDIHYFLPAVFTANPAGSTVNGQFWTIPYELKCYLVLAALAALGIFRRRELLLLTLVGLYVFQIGHTMLKPDIGAHGPMGGNSLVMTFIAGVTVYKFREKIPCNWYLFVICLALTMGSFLVTGGDRFAALPVTYITVFLGLLTPPRQKLLLSGDYSYGIYLYGLPIQQTIAWCGPAYQNWYFSALLGVPLTIAAAIVSWWFIEKRVLDRRDALKKLEGWLLRSNPLKRGSAFRRRRGAT